MPLSWPDRGSRALVRVPSLPCFTPRLSVIRSSQRLLALGDGSAEPGGAVGRGWIGCERRAYARGAYSTLPNGQSDASQSLTARQRGTSSSAWLARTQESARASSPPSGSG